MYFPHQMTTRQNTCAGGIACVRESVLRGCYGLPRLVGRVVPRLFDSPVTVAIRKVNMAATYGARGFCASKSGKKRLLMNMPQSADDRSALARPARPDSSPAPGRNARI